MVHVFALPDEVLDEDERLCSDPEREEHFVVFHPDSGTCSNGDWFCRSCGYSSAPIHPTVQ